MSLFGKILILFSLLAILIATAAAQVSFFPVASSSQHAGCHQPAPSTPAPVTYTCCQAGHDSLLLLNSDFVHASAQVATNVTLTIPTFVDQPFVSFSRYSASPPGHSSPGLPLRV
jgi:hypothetical protein